MDLKNWRDKPDRVDHVFENVDVPRQYDEKYYLESTVEQLLKVVIDDLTAYQDDTSTECSCGEWHNVSIKERGEELKEELGLDVKQYP